jgi:hypothetical protein
MIVWSAWHPKADMFSVEIDVCFVPKADMELAEAIENLPINLT